MVIDGLGYSFGVLLEPIQREFKVTGSAFKIHIQVTLQVQSPYSERLEKHL